MVVDRLRAQIKLKMFELTSQGRKADILFESVIKSTGKLTFPSGHIVVVNAVQLFPFCQVWMISKLISEFDKLFLGPLSTYLFECVMAERHNREYTFSRKRLALVIVIDDVRVLTKIFCTQDMAIND